MNTQTPLDYAYLDTLLLGRKYVLIERMESLDELAAYHRLRMTHDQYLTAVHNIQDELTRLNKILDWSKNLQTVSATDIVKTD